MLKWFSNLIKPKVTTLDKWEDNKHPKVYAHELGLVFATVISEYHRTVYTDGEKFYINKRKGGLVRTTNGEPKTFDTVEDAEKWLMRKQPTC
jgi:hypothetical protein